MFIMMIIMFIMMMIIDHHHVHCSLFNQQSMNNNLCSLINVDRWLCEREQCEVRQWVASILFRVRCAEWRWRVLLLVRRLVRAARALLIPLQCC